MVNLSFKKRFCVRKITLKRRLTELAFVDRSGSITRLDDQKWIKRLDLFAMAVRAGVASVRSEQASSSAIKSPVENWSMGVQGAFRLMPAWPLPGSVYKKFVKTLVVFSA